MTDKKNKNERVLSYLAWLVSFCMLYIHGAELYNRQKGILSFLQMKAELDGVRGVVYSYLWIVLFVILVGLQVFFFIKKRDKWLKIMNVFIFVAFLTSFLLDYSFYRR